MVTHWAKIVQLRIIVEVIMLMICQKEPVNKEEDFKIALNRFVIFVPYKYIW